MILDNLTEFARERIMLQETERKIPTIEIAKRTRRNPLTEMLSSLAERRYRRCQKKYRTSKTPPPSFGCKTESYFHKRCRKCVIEVADKSISMLYV
jgi:predicted P-loop ATPase